MTLKKTKRIGMVREAYVCLGRLKEAYAGLGR